MIEHPIRRPLLKVADIAKNRVLYSPQSACFDGEWRIVHGVNLTPVLLEKQSVLPTPTPDIQHPTIQTLGELLLGLGPVFQGLEVSVAVTIQNEPAIVALFDFISSAMVPGFKAIVYVVTKSIFTWMQSMYEVGVLHDLLCQKSVLIASIFPVIDLNTQ